MALAGRSHGKNSRIYMSEDENTSPVLVLSMAQFGYDDNPDEVDTTCFEDGNKTSLQGYPGGSGTFSGFWDTEEETLWKARDYCKDGGFVKIRFYPNLTRNPDRYIECLGSISCGITSGAADAVKVSGKWSAKGAITNTLGGPNAT